MISTQYINLNMVPSGVMPVLHCSQYDVGRPLGVVIYNGSESVDLSGYTVTIEGTRTDRTPVTAGVTTDGNIGVFTTTPTMTNENDTYRAKVVLTDNAGRVSSLAFVMCVDEKTMDENAEEIEEDASLYQQYTGTVQTIIAQIRSDLVAEANARQAADQTLQQNILGTLGYVTPRMFGAKGNGATVDNSALNDCFEFASTHKIPVYGEGLTYLIDNSTESLCGHYGVIVNGGITISNCHFKLKSGCPDMTVLLACRYDTDPYIINNCVFEGELRTITSSTEDGGNHGIIFCDGVTMFPQNWQDYPGVTIKNCDFKNIQSYGVFPTPIDSTLIVENCSFNCHACGILTYATNTEILNCEYVYLSGSNSTAATLAIDEIENFSNPDSIRKNIRISNCTSSKKIYQIQHVPQDGVIYGKIVLDNCSCDSVLFQTYYASSVTFDIDANEIIIKNCHTNGNLESGDFSVYMRNLSCNNILIDNLTMDASKVRLVLQGSVIFKNCNITFPIAPGSSDLEVFKFINCNFSTLQSDGFITTRWYSVCTCDELYIINCRTKSSSQIIYDINATTIYVSNLIGDGVQIKLLYNSTDTNTNVYIDGLIMPVENPQWSYLIERITGVAVIRGMSAGIRTNSVGTLINDVTEITVSS